MFKRLIEWIKSCFSGSIAVSDQNRGKVNVDIADKKARDRGFVLQRTRGMPKMAQYMEGPDMADCWLYYISHCNYYFDICILREPLCQFLDVCPDYDEFIDQGYSLLQICCQIWHG